ncbi:MAG TPA: hypothetical protein VFE82_02570 [Ramlibacter sp.]|jgi:hypothetical protein|uniref:hypothetical protein n=1 Tax=Ramlibacter sp. TaxID=1917967 RepID=UPI002D2E6A51|nr:hypothetical protein [Ramlibacter sp.]HZY17332.1 hypothetical protein [Ramlibacter sp.]
MYTSYAPREEIDSAPPAPSTPAEAGPGTPVARRAGGVLVTTVVPQQKTAWTKARMDVLHLLRGAGYAHVELPDGANPVHWLDFLGQLDRLVDRGGHVVIEYPFDQRKRAYLLHMFCRVRGARLFALIHDLDSLRHEESPPEREIAILRLFDGLVSHNATMTEWLRGQGVGAKVVNLNLFDYCSPPGPTWHETRLTTPLKVVCAGNLSYPKASYVYDERLAQLRQVELSLFGAFFEPERLRHPGPRYKGVFDPDQPALDGRYHFGLIWDGQSIDGCQGNYGQYMRYNNPHKLSLYLSLGLPVIVWKEAAIAPLVLGRGVGVLIGDLREMDAIPDWLDNQGYQQMAANAARLSPRVRRGDFLQDAIGRLVR